MLDGFDYALATISPRNFLKRKTTEVGSRKEMKNRGFKVGKLPMLKCHH